MDATTDQHLLEERYGTHRPVRRAIGLVVVVLVAGAGLGWLAWAAWVNSDVPIQGAVSSFDVRGAHRVDTTVDLRVRDRYTEGTCLLRASAVDHAIVGETSLRVDGRQARRQHVVVRTERRATTVEVIRCTAD